MDKQIAFTIYQLTMTTGVRMLSIILNEMTVPPTDKESMKRFKCMLGLITCADYANRNPDFREEIYEKHLSPMLDMINQRKAESAIKDILGDLIKNAETKPSPQSDTGPRPDLN